MKTLKKPKILWILSASLVLAPVFNLIFSVVVQRPSVLSTPLGMKYYLSQIHWRAWLWMLIMVASGIALFSQRRAGWALAAFGLFVSLCYQTFIVLPKIDGTPWMYFSVVLSAATLSAALVYFRYPYLDRRDNFWSLSDRVAGSHAVSFQGVPIGTIKNISRTGALLALSKKSIYKIDQEIQFMLEETLFRARIVRSPSPHEVGIKFVKLTLDQKKSLESIISKLRKRK